MKTRLQNEYKIIFDLAPFHHCLISSGYLAKSQKSFAGISQSCYNGRIRIVFYSQFKR